MALDSPAFDEADVNAYVDGRLDHARAAALAASLAGDPSASARVDGWKRQNEGLRSLFASVLFEPLPVRLLPATVAADPSHRNPPAPARSTAAPPGPERGGVLVSAAVGVALLSFVVGALASLATDGFGRAGWPARPAEPRVVDDGPDLARRAAEVYQALLADPARAADVVSPADEARFGRWMKRQVSTAVRVPDLHKGGWTFLGGRAAPGRYGPAALLVYGSGADRLGLYVARAPVPAAPSTTVFEDGPAPVAVAAWSDDGVGYALAAGREGGRFDRDGLALRDAVRRQMREDTP